VSKDNLGDRMKGYENVSRNYLTRRMPTIIRIDGKSFHSFTKGFTKPLDMIMVSAMWDTASYLCKNIMGCKLAYVQSDEISLLLTDYDKLESQPWFDKNIQKMVSVSASMATLAFNKSFKTNTERFKDSIEVDKTVDYDKKFDTAMFDSRVFNIPKEEACNCFIWRQQDATRNAIEALGQANFSHKLLHGKNCKQIQEMLFQEKGINFNDCPTHQKRGACIVKESYDKDGCMRTRWIVDLDIPIFAQDRNYIEKYI
jgi:tRNA(His) guanylyltransferase